MHVRIAELYIILKKKTKKQIAFLGFLWKKSIGDDPIMQDTYN